jgi:hypothetical protein
MPAACLALHAYGALDSRTYPLAKNFFTGRLFRLSRGSESRSLARIGVSDSLSEASNDQRPSLDLSRSLTACGLALPPDDFIT